MTARIPMPPRDQLAALYAEHGSYRNVARVLGVSKSRVQVWMQQARLPRRPVSSAIPATSHPWKAGLRGSRAA